MDAGVVRLALTMMCNAFQALKMPSAAIHLKETDNVVEHNLKPSSLAEDTRDSNVQQLPSMKVNSVQNYLPKNRHQNSGMRSNHVCPANMFPKYDKDKEGNVCNNITLVENGGMLFGEENTGEPFSILAMENSTTDASHSYGMKDSANNQSSPSHSPSDDNGCRDHKAYSNGSSRFQVEETSKSEVPNAMNLSSKNPLEKITSQNPRKTGEPKQSNVIYGKSEFNFVHSREEERCPLQPDISVQDPEPVRCRNGFVAKTEVKNDQQGNVKYNLGDISTSSRTQSTEWEKENTAVVHSLQKKRLICETREATEESHMRNAGLNFEKKVCVFPRDSHIMNGGIPGDIPYPQQRRGHTHEFINPSNSLPNTSAMEKESDHVKAYLSENASGLVKFSIHGNCSDYGYRGFPLDSQGAVLHHIPNTIPRFNQLYMIPNYPASNEPLISQGTKAFREFNFVESLKTFPDVPPINRPLHVSSFHCLPQQNYSAKCKQPDFRQENSVSKTNLSNPDMRGSEYSSLLDEIQRDGGSNARMYGSSFGTPDTISRFSMHPTVQSGYSGDKRQKASIFEKTCPEVDISRRKQSTTQAVMRLMGHSFSIGGENETGNALRDTHQWNSKDNQSSSGAIVGVSSSMKLMTHYMDHCTACTKGQIFLTKPGGNAMCHDCRGKANIEKNLSNNFCKEMRCSETLATHKVGTLNNDAPDLVEKRLLADCLLHGEPLNHRNGSGQEWKSNPPFSSSVANMFISPISHLSNNTCLNEGQKKGYRASHVSKPGCPVQKQTYIELLNSCLAQQMFQKQDCNPLETHQ